MGKGLVVLHIDGLGADSLEQALHEGDMPFTQRMIDAEGYAIHRYRCGVPSTTPFAQAGILYGDNAAHRAPIDTMTGLEIFLSQAGYAFGNAVFAAEKARR